MSKASRDMSIFFLNFKVKRSSSLLLSIHRTFWFCDNKCLIVWPIVLLVAGVNGRPQLRPRFTDFLLLAYTSHGAPNRRSQWSKTLVPMQGSNKIPLVCDTWPFRGMLWQNSPICPEIGNPIKKKTANNLKTVRYREKVTVDHLEEPGARLSESAVILVAMVTEMGETLHRSPPNAVEACNSATVRDAVKDCIIH